MDNITKWIPQNDIEFSANICDCKISVRKVEIPEGVTVIITTPTFIYNISYRTSECLEPDYLSVWHIKEEILFEYDEELIIGNANVEFMLRNCEFFVESVMNSQGRSGNCESKL